VAKKRDGWLSRNKGLLRTFVARLLATAPLRVPIQIPAIPQKYKMGDIIKGVATTTCSQKIIQNITHQQTQVFIFLKYLSNSGESLRKG
jgi:hypothetical protein